MSELEEYVRNEQCRKIADHMDFGVISMLLVDSCGWTRVYLHFTDYDPNTAEIMSWANSNCAGRFMHHAEDFIFENANDALMFKLKWS
jgi:hypothetical protein